MDARFLTTRRSLLAGITAVAGSLTISRSALGMLDAAAARPDDFVSAKPDKLVPFPMTQVRLLDGLFKQQAGISLTAFRQRKCLERFLRLYGRGARYTLLQAALEAGFGSYAQFHRVFGSVMRLSPAAYRRSLGQGRA